MLFNGLDCMELIWCISFFGKSMPVVEGVIVLRLSAGKRHEWGHSGKHGTSLCLRFVGKTEHECVSHHRKETRNTSYFALQLLNLKCFQPFCHQPVNHRARKEETQNTHISTISQCLRHQLSNKNMLNTTREWTEDQFNYCYAGDES